MKFLDIFSLPTLQNLLINHFNFNNKQILLDLHLCFKIYDLIYGAYTVQHSERAQCRQQQLTEGLASSYKSVVLSNFRKIIFIKAADLYIYMIIFIYMR